MADFQDLDHLDGLSISVTSANLYNNDRDDLVLFYFRNGAEYASVYTQSKVISENIKWNKSIKNKKIKALLVNARNANCLTGSKGYNSLREIAEETAKIIEHETAKRAAAAKADIGKVIGKEGRIANAIRTIVKAAAAKTEKKVTVEILTNDG